jgi:hypothetical protein
MFNLEDMYTMKVDINSVLNAFEDDKPEPDMKDGNNTSDDIKLVKETYKFLGTS